MIHPTLVSGELAASYDLAAALIDATNHPELLEDAAERLDRDHPTLARVLRQLAAPTDTRDMLLKSVTGLRNGAIAETSRALDRLSSVLSFVNEACVVGAENEVAMVDLWNAYVTYCREGGRLQLSRRPFHNKIRDQGFAQVDDHGTMFWTGIGLRVWGQWGTDRDTPAPAPAPSRARVVPLRAVGGAR